jgi:hypothetical protein
MKVIHEGAGLHQDARQGGAGEQSTRAGAFSHAGACSATSSPARDHPAPDRLAGRAEFGAVKHFPGVSPSGYDACPSMVGALPPTLMATFLGLRSSGLGIRSSRTPLAKPALMPSGSIPSGKVSERENAP